MRSDEAPSPRPRRLRGADRGAPGRPPGRAERITVRRVEPDGLVEVVLRQLGGVGDQVEVAPPQEMPRPAGLESDRLGVVLDGAWRSLSCCFAPARAARIAQADVLSLASERIARADHVVIALQIQQHLDPQLMGILTVTIHLDGGLTRCKGLGQVDERRAAAWRAVRDRAPAPDWPGIQVGSLDPGRAAPSLVDRAVGSFRASSTSARARYKAAEPGCSAMARVNCSIASSGFCCRW